MATKEVEVVYAPPGEWSATSINTVKGAAISRGEPQRRYLKPYARDAIKGQKKPAHGPDDPSYRRPPEMQLRRKQQYERLKSAPC